MSKWLGACLMAVVMVCAGGSAWAKAPRVVVSIAPLHGLVLGVMAGSANPTLLMPGKSSPHTFSLRPSDAKALSEAELVLWVGESLETSLTRVLPTLAPKARRVALLETPGLKLLPMRRGEAWGAHEHGHDHAHEGAAPLKEMDPHFWLDPTNSQVVVLAVAELLAEMDPEAANLYRGNAKHLVGELNKIDREMAKSLSFVKGIPFVVFHDAYQYLERRYGLKAVGAVAVSPEQAPGAKRIAELRETIRASGAHCLFAEPQFESALLTSLLRDTGIHGGVLDPLGAGLLPGPDGYFHVFREMAFSLRNCLTRK